MPIGDADEVEQVFDAISYCKGGAVVRMVNEVVGDDAFVRGLRAYMREFAYGNAQTDDLWSAWEKASGKPVTDEAASSSLPPRSHPWQRAPL